MFAFRVANISFRRYAVSPIAKAYSRVNNIPIRTYSSEKKDYVKMVDPKRVVSYEDMLKVIHQPQKVIIDVRNPDEVNDTGKIPSSINIPLGNVQDVLASMSNEEFRKQYNREKPSASDELIFYCRSGKRSSEALDRALKLGYTQKRIWVAGTTGQTVPSDEILFCRC